MPENEASELLYKYSRFFEVPVTEETAYLLVSLTIDRAVGFVFSRKGFTAEAEEYCREKGIACSEDERWLESGK